MTQVYKIAVEGPIRNPAGDWVVLATVEGSSTETMKFDSEMAAGEFMDELSRYIMARAPGAARKNVSTAFSRQNWEKVKMVFRASVKRNGQVLTTVEHDVRQDGDLERLIKELTNKFRNAFPDESLFDPDIAITVEAPPSSN